VPVSSHQEWRSSPRRGNTPEGAVLEIRDSRTGHSYELKIEDGTIAAGALREIKTHDEDAGLFSYDPGMFNTALCRSALTLLDTDHGILEFCGYPAGELAEHASFLEVAYLLHKGELPNPKDLSIWAEQIYASADLPDEIYRALGELPSSVHPLNILVGLFGLLGGFYPDSLDTKDINKAEIHACRIIGQMPVLVAAACRHFQGKGPLKPSWTEGYAEGFLHLLLGEEPHHPDVGRAFEILLILTADHEQDPWTTAVRLVGATDADPYAAVSAGFAALSGGRHGRGAERAQRLWREIGDPANVAAFCRDATERGSQPAGLGHYMYGSHGEPRAQAIKDAAHAVLATGAANPPVEVALEIERIATTDPYFIEHSWYPNRGFYTGLIYESLGLPPEFIGPIIGAGRAAGWTAQWLEMLREPDRNGVRPHQIYVGPVHREYRGGA
jgi:citrate synthase